MKHNYTCATIFFLPCLLHASVGNQARASQVAVIVYSTTSDRLSFLHTPFVGMQLCGNGCKFEWVGVRDCMFNLYQICLSMNAQITTRLSRSLQMVVWLDNEKERPNQNQNILWDRSACTIQENHTFMLKSSEEWKDERSWKSLLVSGHKRGKDGLTLNGKSLIYRGEDISGHKVGLKHLFCSV